MSNQNDEKCPNGALHAEEDLLAKGVTSGNREPATNESMKAGRAVPQRGVGRSKTDESQEGTLRFLRDTARRETENAIGELVQAVTNQQPDDKKCLQPQTSAMDASEVSHDYLDDYLAARYNRDPKSEELAVGKGQKGQDPSPAERNLGGKLRQSNPEPRQRLPTRGSRPEQPITRSLPGAYPQAPLGVPVAADDYLNDFSQPRDVSQPLDVEEGNSPAVPDSGLVEAFPVEESSTRPRAEPMGSPAKLEEEKARKKDKERTKVQFFVLGGVCLMVGLGIILAIVLSRRDSSDSSSANTVAPTSVAVNETQTIGLLLDLPMKLPEATLETIRSDTNGTTPQYRAYQWLKDDPFLSNYTDDEQRLVQRFVAATFYYATNGEYWTDAGGNTTTVIQDATSVGNTEYQVESGTLVSLEITSTRWLSYGSHECDWYNTATEESFCDEDGWFDSFEMTKNNVSGTIPDELGLLKSLKQIKFGLGEIRGTLPTQLGLLTKLAELRVFRTFVRGELPSELGLLSNSLTDISLIQNELSGSIPSEIWQLSKLKSFAVNRNDLSGRLPPDIGIKMPNLKKLRATENKLFGSLPTSLGLCTKLEQIDLEANQISGTIPSELGQPVNLENLELHDNLIIGTVPSELGNLPVLVQLLLENNVGIVGTLPPNLRLLNDTDAALHITGTSLSGTIPEALCMVQELEFDCSATLCGCDCTC